jgi:tetratricopeptide (TPR) repeat protein
VKIKPNPSQRDYFDAGFAYYAGRDLLKADSLAVIYTQKWPDEQYGWSLCYEANRLRDSAMEKGLAIPCALKYQQILEKDTAKNKKSILSVSNYLVVYYANYAKDKEKAIVHLKKMIALDPANEDYQKNLKILEKAPASRPAKPTPAPKPKAKTTTKAPVKKTVSK